MKCGWCQTINNAVCCYQTPFNITLILEQVSNCNNLLREKMSIEKATCMNQSNVISDEKSFASKLRATENEHTPTGLEEKSEDNDSKVMNYDNWIQPKSSCQLRVFSKKGKIKLSLRMIITNITC